MDILIWWLVLSGVVAAVAAAAGRGAGGYLLLSLVLSPLIGFLVLLVMIVAKPAKSSAPADDRPRIACPQCAEMVLPQATKCPHCGYGVSAHVQREQQERDRRAQQLSRERAEAARQRGERWAYRLRRWLRLD